MATKGVATLPALMSPGRLTVRPAGDKCREGDLMRVICRRMHSFDLNLGTGVGCNELYIQQMHGDRQAVMTVCCISVVGSLCSCYCSWVGQETSSHMEIFKYKIIYFEMYCFIFLEKSRGTRDNRAPILVSNRNLLHHICSKIDNSKTTTHSHSRLLDTTALSGAPVVSSRSTRHPSASVLDVQNLSFSVAQNPSC